MAFDEYMRLNSPNQGNPGLATQIKATVALGDIFRTSLGPAGQAKLVFDKEKNVLVATADGYTLVKEIGDLTAPAVPKALLKLAETQYKTAGDFTKTVMVLATAWLRHLLALGDELHRHRQVARDFNNTVTNLLKTLDFMALSLSPPPDASPHNAIEVILRQHLSAKMAPRVGTHFATLLAPRTVEWVRKIPPRAHLSSREYLPPFFQTVISPGAHLSDSYLFDGLVFTKEVDVAEKMFSLPNARVLMTQEKLYTEKPTQLQAEFTIKRPEDLPKFKAREQIFQPNLPSLLAGLGVNLLVTEKGISPILQEKLAKQGVLIIRRAKLRQMTRLAQACAKSVVGRALDAAPEDLILSPQVFSEKIRGEWRVFVELPFPGACALVIRCSDYDIGKEARRVIKSALRATLGSIHASKFLPGAGAWQAFAAHFCRHFSSTPAKGNEIAAEGFTSLLQTLVENAGMDPLEGASQMIKQNQGEIKDFIGLQHSKRILAPINEIHIFDSWRGVFLAIDHARQFVIQILNVDDVIYYDRKPQKN